MTKITKEPSKKRKSIDDKKDSKKKKTVSNKKSKIPKVEEKEDTQVDASEDRAAIAIKLNKLTGSILLQEKDIKERDKEVAELFASLKTKVAKYALRHDMSRSIQACYRFGTDEMKDTILKELEGSIVTLSKSKYACFLVIAMLRYSNYHQRVKLLNELRNSLSRLGTHSCGARVVDFAFSISTNDLSPVPAKGKTPAMDKKTMTRNLDTLVKKLKLEFYGPELSVFANPIETIDNKKDYENEMFRSLDLKKRRAVLDHLDRMATKQAEKGLLVYKYAHDVVFNLIRHCEDMMEENKDDCEEEKKILQKIIPVIAEACLAMTSSQNGAWAVARCISQSSAKERKIFCRTIKGHVGELCFHEFGYIVITTLLHVVDDTVLLKKNIVAEMNELKLAPILLASLMNEEVCHGRESYLEVLAPGNKRYFSKKEQELMTPAPGTSKKDLESKRTELMGSIKEVSLATCQEHVVEMLKNQLAADIVVETMAAFPDHNLGEEVSQELTKTFDILEDPTGHRNLKRAIAFFNDKEAQSILNILEPKLQDLVSINRACFILVALMEHAATSAALKKILSKSAILNKLQKSDGAGAKVLVKLIQSKK